MLLQPGPRHWDIFRELCRRVQATGNLVPDAYLAALAMESGCEWVTTDRDYARFPGLNWCHPFAS
ncbi:MAG: PIN domain-containing protein [Pirellulales bacterium]|nr:PIN domain-containing protein [Pirellulales bacterium]